MLSFPELSIVFRLEKYKKKKKFRRCPCCDPSDNVSKPWQPEPRKNTTEKGGEKKSHWIDLSYSLCSHTISQSSASIKRASTSFSYLLTLNGKSPPAPPEPLLHSPAHTAKHNRINFRHRMGLMKHNPPSPAPLRAIIIIGGLFFKNYG